MFRDNRWIRILKPKLREWKITAVLLRRNNLTKIALSISLLLILTALLASFIIPHPEHIEDEVNLDHKLEAPSLEYIFGTDEMGRDIFSRVIYGTKISLQTALFAVAVSMMIGIPLGAIAGTSGGKVDEIIMRLTDMIMGFPPLLLCIAVTSILGPSLRNVILAISIAWWPLYARLVRGQAVSIRERQFVKSAQAIGTSHMGIVFKHVIPNCVSPVIVQASIDIGGAILTVSSLSFLGLGAQAPTPEWGLMISTSRNYFLNAWWYSIFPGLAIFFTVLVFNLLGDGLREILDPKTRKN